MRTRNKHCQIDVFRLRCLGYMPKEIADALGISVKTAEWHWALAVRQLDSWGVRRELERGDSLGYHFQTDSTKDGISMNCKHNSTEQEQACIAGDCPICLLEERDQLKARLKAAEDKLAEMEALDGEAQHGYGEMQRQIDGLTQQLEAARRGIDMANRELGKLSHDRAQLAAMVDMLRGAGMRYDDAIEYWVYGNGRKLCGTEIWNQCFAALVNWRKIVSASPPTALAEVLKPTMEVIGSYIEWSERDGFEESADELKVELSRLQKLVGGGE